MNKAEAILAVRKYVSAALPVSSLSKLGVWRRAWAASHIPGIGLIDFENIVTAQGYTPRKFGEVWILQFPGKAPARLADGSITCEGAS